MDSNFQGNGIGKKLFYDYILKKVENVSRLIAIRAMIVFVEPHNKKGINFYKSLGFERADSIVQQTIGETFNEKCDLYYLSLMNEEESDSGK